MGDTEQLVEVFSEVVIEDGEKIMEANGYPKKFVRKNIKTQLKRLHKNTVPAFEEEKMTVNIPFINGLSEQVKRVARMTVIGCTFYTQQTPAKVSVLGKGCPPKRKYHPYHILLDL